MTMTTGIAYPERAAWRAACVVLVVVLLGGLPQRSSGARCEAAFCRCVSTSARGVSTAQFVSGQRDRADRVVLGKVVAIDTLPPRIVPHGPTNVAVRSLAAWVIVSRVWKGQRSDTLRVVFGSIGVASSCDLELKVGTTYVLFATRGEDGLLRTRQCTGTAPELEAATTITALGAGEVPER